MKKPKLITEEVQITTTVRITYEKKKDARDYAIAVAKQGCGHVFGSTVKYGIYDIRTVQRVND